MRATKLRSTASDWIYVALLLLALAGMGVSAYLMWGYTVPGASLACGGSHGCEAVKNSDYASLMGLPLPLIGLATYLTILVLLVLQRRFGSSKSDWLSYIILAVFGISLTGVLYSAYLTYVELYVIYAICRWCVLSAAIMAVIFLLSTLNLHRGMMVTSQVDG
jgi:uncharacterized membrane protein